MIEKINQFQVDPKTGIIRALETSAGIVALTSGGIEIGNWLGFCSQESLSGVNCEVDQVSVDVLPNKVKTTFHVELPKSRFAISITERLESGAWMREASATALSPSWIGDFVLRFGVSSNHFPNAGTKNRCIHHKSRNTYYQYHIDNVSFWSSFNKLTTQSMSDIEAGRLDRVSYWRDQPDGQWIQHHRLIVKQSDWDVVVLRCRRRVFNSDERKILRNWLIWRPFWSLNEAIFSRLPFNSFPTLQTQGVVKVKKGETLMLASKVNLETFDR